MKKHWRTIVVALVLAIAPVSVVSAAPIPLDEELVFVQSLHVDTSVEAMQLFLRDDTGLLDPTAFLLYSGSFTLSDDALGNPTAMYAGVLTGEYLGFAIEGEYSGQMASIGPLDAQTLDFTLESKIKIKDREGNTIKELKDKGKLTEKPGNKADVEIEVEDERGTKKKIVNDGDLNKVKDEATKTFDVRGVVIVDGNAETFKLLLRQDGKTFGSLLLSPPNLSWSNDGSYAAVGGAPRFDIAFSLTPVPEPSVLMLLGPSAVGFALVRLRRRHLARPTR